MHIRPHDIGDYVIKQQHTS